MTRVSFDIPNDLHEEFKTYAAEHKVSLKSLFVNSVEKILAKSRVPNAETLGAIKDSKDIKNLTHCGGTKELFARFGIVHE